MSKIPQWHKWELKFVFSKYIYPRLIEYKNEVESRNIQSIPNWVIVEFNEENYNEDLLYSKWVEILELMIFAFKSNLILDLNSDNDFEEKRNKGLMYFSKYFNNLWD